MKVAILVDGGFYRKRAYYFWGDQTPKNRALELKNYCWKHITKEKDGAELYRIFYYDCPPSSKKVYHPLTKVAVDLEKSEQYEWSIEFINELKHQRKFALRMGRLGEEQAAYTLPPKKIRKLVNNTLDISSLTVDDFILSIPQKGVDMKIGVDISSLAFKHQVDRIVLISGDSDFVPAAKQARREGIDFVLDPMRQKVKEDLFEHIDGIHSYTPTSPVN